MVTIAAPRAWALSTLRQRSWMSHVLTAGTWPWRCCVPDTSSLDGGVSPLLCPVLVPPPDGLLRLRARVIWGLQWELPRRVRLRGPLTPPAHRTVWGSRMSMRGPSDRAGPSISFGAPADDGLSITAIGGWARFWRGRFGCAASVRKSSVARVRSRTDRYAFPGCWEHRAAL